MDSFHAGVLEALTSLAKSGVGGGAGGGTQGPMGPKGDKGDAGQVGPQGVVGPQGLQGPQGSPGTQGAKGNTGDTGGQGLQGVPGVKGDKGDTGTQGIPGTPGAAGKSAYDTWIDLGNVGTPTDFLTWLRGGSSGSTASASATMLPASSQIIDSTGGTWTLRMSDRAVLRNGATTGLTDVIELWYLSGVVWAYLGNGWKSYTGSAWSATTDWRVKPAGFPTTAALRSTVGPKVLANYAGVQISAGANIQAVVDANPAGTTYVLAIGTYNQQTVTPKNGDTFIGLFNGTNGAVLDGQDTAGAAFWGTAQYVTIKNLIVKKYKPGTQHGQIEVIGKFLTVQDCEVANSTATFGGGLYLSQKALVLGCDIHHNSQQGYTVHGDIMGYTAQVGVTLDGNLIRDNNPADVEMPGSEQGGGKALETQYFAAWFNEIRGNGGSGIWMDSNNIWTTIWANKFNGYGWNGVEIEISYDFQVKYNDFTGFVAPQGTGYFSEAALAIGCSGGVDSANESEISYNLFATTPNTRLIAARQQQRILGDRYNIGVIRYVRNIYVHHNTIAMTGTTTVWDAVIGLQWDYDPDGVVHGPNKMRFDNNTYTVEAPFTQMWAIGGNLTNQSFAQFQASGQEANGTYSGPTPAVEWGGVNANITLSGTPKLVATGTGASGVNYPGVGNSATVIGAGIKRAWKIVVTTKVTNIGVGIANGSVSVANDQYLGNNDTSIGWYANGQVYKNAQGTGGSPVATWGAFVQGDTLTLAVDGNNKLWGAVNGVFTGNPATATGGLSISGMGDVYPAHNLQSGDKITAAFVGATGLPSGFPAFT